MRWNTMALLALTALLTLGLVSMAGCGGGEGEATETAVDETASTETMQAKPAETMDETMSEEKEMPQHDGPMTTLTIIEGGERTTREVPYLPEGPKVATIETSKGVIRIELWEDKAPNTVKNFAYLANSGRYDGVEFHRVIDGFMAQTGDVEHKGGYGGPGYTIPAEFDPELKHERGVLSMARSQDPDSAGSQFFIMLDAAGHLDGKYAAFGKVIEGMDVVDSLKKGDKAQNGKVEDPDVMTKVRVDVAE
jgi:peptidyl-prolyl cis-trans isomerase B (cyclophilin B)